MHFWNWRWLRWPKWMKCHSKWMWNSVWITRQTWYDNRIYHWLKWIISHSFPTCMHEIPFPMTTYNGQSSNRGNGRWWCQHSAHYVACEHNNHHSFEERPKWKSNNITWVQNSINGNYLLLAMMGCSGCTLSHTFHFTAIGCKGNKVFRLRNEISDQHEIGDDTVAIGDRFR